MARLWSSRFGQIILLLLLNLGLSSGQYIPVYSVNPAGTTYWSATVGAPATQVTSVASIPTLVYNCHITPALCANVESAGRIGAASGSYPAPGFESFGYDPDSARKSRRRQSNCPSNWRTKKGNPHKCPETNQAVIRPVGVTGGLSYKMDQSNGGLTVNDPKTGWDSIPNFSYTRPFFKFYQI